MNRRKAKKKVKRKWRIDRWPGNADPREVDAIYSEVHRRFHEAFAKALDEAILYGSGRPLPMPPGIMGRLY